MFGDGGPPKKGPQPDVTSQPTDRLEAIKQGEPVPAAPRPAPPKPAPPKPAATLASPAKPAPVAPTPAPTSPAPKRVAAKDTPPVERPSEDLKQKVLDHTAKLRRSLLEGTRPPEPPKPAPEPPKPAEPEPALDPGPTSSPDDSAALRRALVERTQKTTLRDLEKKGLKQVQVLDMRTIEKIVSEAVERALEKRHLTAGTKKQLEQEAKREFLELMDEHKRALAEKSDEERRARDLEKTVEKLRAEVARQEAVLSEQRESATVAISPASLAELETSCKRLLSEFMTGERRALVAEANPKAEEGIGALEKKLAEAFDRLVGRIKSDYEDLLERRIDKLNKALSDTENALRQLAKMKSIDPGIASIYDSVQGLSLDELNFERKKELLAVVFLENLAIQGKEITDEDRNAATIKSTLDSQKPEPSIEAPEGFEPPLDPLTTETAF